MAAAVIQTKEAQDAMVIDAIDYMASCIADSLSDLPVEERDKQRNELVRTFAEGLLIKAKNAENRNKAPAKKSLSLFIAYIRPTPAERLSMETQMQSQQPDMVDENRIRLFQEQMIEGQKKGSVTSNA